MLILIKSGFAQSRTETKILPQVDEYKPQLLKQVLDEARQHYPSLAPHPKMKCERVGLRVHLTPRGSYQASLLIPQEEAYQSDLKWLDQQVSEANRLFKTLKICFEVDEIVTHLASDARMQTRMQRSALGRLGRFKVGVIELFIVDRLDDVDEPDAYIRGVHWRHPDDRNRKRWIILSRIARPLVLPHELGHYFSLPHGKDPMSIMNKTKRENPPMHERGFTKAEYQQMQRAWRTMKRSGHLKARSQ